MILSIIFKQRKGRHYQTHINNNKQENYQQRFTFPRSRTIRRPINRKTKNGKKFPDQTNMLLKTKNPDHTKKEKKNPETYRLYEQL